MEMGKMTCFAHVGCAVLVIVQLFLSPSDARALKFRRATNAVSPKVTNPFVVKNSVQVKVEQLPGIKPDEKQEWLIYTITNEEGVVDDVMGMKLDAGRSLTIPRELFCRLWRAALLDDIVHVNDDQFLLSSLHPAAAVISDLRTPTQLKTPGVFRMKKEKIRRRRAVRARLQ